MLFYRSRVFTSCFMPTLSSSVVARCELSSYFDENEVYVFMPVCVLIPSIVSIKCHFIWINFKIALLS